MIPAFVVQIQTRGTIHRQRVDLKSMFIICDCSKEPSPQAGLAKTQHPENDETWAVRELVASIATVKLLSHTCADELAA